jgi:hypothetical protein
MHQGTYKAISSKICTIRRALCYAKKMNFWAVLTGIWRTSTTACRKFVALSFWTLPLISTDGSALITYKKIREKWAEHFDDVLTTFSPSTTKPVIIYHRFWSVGSWMRHPLSKINRNQYTICPPAYPIVHTVSQ